MLKWLIVGVVLAIAAVLLLVGRQHRPDQLSVAYQQQYWTKQVSKIIGPAWQVTAVQEITAPLGWKRTAGGTGILVSFRAPGITLQHPVVGPYHPGATLYLMPSGWEGECRIHGYDLALTKKGFRDESRPSPVQFYPAAYDGRTWRYHLFRSSLGDGDLVDWERLEGTLGPRLKPPAKQPGRP